MNHTFITRAGLVGIFLVALGLRSASVIADTEYFVGTPPGIAQVPLYVKDSTPPLNMLVMGKDHKIYYEAYNDASDLNGDGGLDIGYRGWETETVAGVTRYKIDYYGYFNSYACYTWNSTGNRFEPAAATANKQCRGQWSGDFLNYLTTSRMDALRRVLYGGWRQVDSETETVLQGAFFPQDAHSWGKEYQSVARDGYNIANYSPLSAPPADRYHLFAVTTFSDNTAPTFRVMQNSPYRIWNWLSIEGPVAGNSCFNASNSRVTCPGTGAPRPFPGNPNNSAEFDTLVTNYAVPANLYGGTTLGLGNPNTINCNNNDCNPYGPDDEYLSVFEGRINIRNRRGGNYQFRVDGDDAIDFELRDTSGNVLATAGCYGGRGFGACGGAETSATVNLGANTDYSFKFRHEEANGGDGYLLEWRKTSGSNQFDWRPITTRSSDADGNGDFVDATTFNTYDLTPDESSGDSRQDYAVRVLTCPSSAPTVRESTCKSYPNGQYKPTGILHDYGEGDAPKMYFGLITGSQNNNLEGGILRKNISNFTSEIISNTGQFRTDVTGIARTIDKLRMIGGAYNDSVTDNYSGDTNWNWANGYGNCTSQGSRAVNNGECRMWGNPIGEMLFESMRYFAGATAATTRFETGGGTEGVTEETAMGLPRGVTWKNPYGAAPAGSGYDRCAKPYQTIISDVNPSYDGDMPGSAFNNTGTDSVVAGFNAATEGNAIWNAEFGAGARNVFIGDVAGTTDGAPTAKSASSFGNIRGLAPEEPTKGGTYYSASVARYGRNNDINAAAGAQNISTYSIALASNLPRIQFPINGQTVTLLPFAKTASGTFGGGTRKPTNTIVDFYVQQLSNLPGGEFVSGANGGRPYAVFRINYEDVEQGNDHDMDAIVRYEVLANADNTVTVNLTSEYAAGSADQNIGYVMFGTTRDGIYLDVRDVDSSAATFAPYGFNTPPGVNPGGCQGVTTGACGQQLPITATRTFTAATTGSTAIQLKDPLWYAAKYGAPDLANWDQNGDGTPDNYLLVSNPLQLRTQLQRAFDDITTRELDPGNVAISGARVGGSSFTVQPGFKSDRGGKDWSGDVTAYAINARTGALGAKLWNAQAKLPPNGGTTAASRNIRIMTTPGVSTTKVAADFQPASLGNVATGEPFDRMGIAHVPGVDLADIGSGLPIYTSQNVVDYLRGDSTRERRNTGAANTLRSRSTSVLGDIVNSEPVVASPKSDFGYGSFTDTMFSGYDGTGGYLSTKSTRVPVVYAGANDGMLHAFNASTVPCTADTTQACATSASGNELFAFIPNAVIGNLGNLVQPDASFNHRYYVDGQISVVDAKDGSTWKTVLVGSTGAGARSIFALDISNPTSFGNTSALWELNSAVDTDIGYIYGKPLLLPLENGQWGVLFGNGYGGSNSDPSLYIVNAFTGALIKKITADDGDTGPDTDADNDLTDPYNGLGQITAIDRDGDGKADTVYGGDLQGNLWKFDLSNASATAWAVAYSGSPLFTAANGGQRQPITGGIRISAGPGTGQMVYFGTGRYFVNGDNTVPSTPQVQSLYGVWDNNATAAGTRANLQGQTIVSEVQTGTATPSTTDDDFLTRNISQNVVRFYGTGAKRGWYLDLAVSSGTPPVLNAVGERFIAVPRIQSGRVFFTTYTPSSTDCEPGGTNFVYGLDLLSGQGGLSNVSVLPSTTPACTDAACGGVAARNQNGGTSQPPIMGTGVAAINPVTQINPTCNSATEVCATFEQCQVVIYPGQFVLPRACGRQSWRQLK